MVALTWLAAVPALVFSASARNHACNRSLAIVAVADAVTVTAGCCGGVGCANTGAAAHAAIATSSARVRTNGYERLDFIDVSFA